MATISIEKRRRGVFGWLVAIVFWGYNLFMLVWFSLSVGLFSRAMQQGPPMTEARRAGVALGAGIAWTGFLGMWLLGAVILGLMMLFTRGKKITITKTVPD
jgi:hypothetical protein